MEKEKSENIPPDRLVEKYEGITTSQEAKRYVEERLESMNDEDLKEYGSIRNLCRNMVYEVKLLAPEYKKRSPIAIGTLNHFMRKQKKKETYIGKRISKIRSQDL